MLSYALKIILKNWISTDVWSYRHETIYTSKTPFKSLCGYFFHKSNKFLKEKIKRALHIKSETKTFHKQELAGHSQLKMGNYNYISRKYSLTYQIKWSAMHCKSVLSSSPFPIHLLLLMLCQGGDHLQRTTPSSSFVASPWCSSTAFFNTSDSRRTSLWFFSNPFPGNRPFPFIHFTSPNIKGIVSPGCPRTTHTSFTPTPSTLLPTYVLSCIFYKTSKLQTNQHKQVLNLNLLSAAYGSLPGFGLLPPLTYIPSIIPVNQIFIRPCCVSCLSEYLIRYFTHFFHPSLSLHTLTPHSLSSLY